MYPPIQRKKESNVLGINLIAILVSLVLGLLVFASSLRAEVRIVNGTESADGAWPFVVSILSSGKSNPLQRQKCGGTLIAPDLVLTAAHCMPSPYRGISWASSLSVLLGTSTLDSDQGIELAVTEFIVHPNYDTSAYGGTPYDFALLRLERPVSLPTVTLASDSDRAYYEAGQEAVITGWGVTNEKKGKSQNELREGIVEMVSDASCKEAYRSNFDEESMVCAGTPNSEKAVDTCYGDSGGPIFVQKGSEWMQVGVTSWGYGCADPNFPGVYAEVAKVLPWIEENLEFAERLPQTLSSIEALSNKVIRISKRDSHPETKWSKSYYAKKALQEKVHTLKNLRDNNEAEIHLLFPNVSDEELTQIERLAQSVCHGKNLRKRKDKRIEAVKSLHQLITEARSVISLP